MSEPKEILREQARGFRDRMDLISEDVEAAAALFFEKINPTPDQIIAAYWPKGNEFDPSPMLERLLKSGNQCVLPVIEEGRRVLKFVAWDESVKLKAGAFNIMQPQSDESVIPDIVIVPMLAFDRRGYRLGQGGGYYDATLSHLRVHKDIIAVGVAYAQQACLFNLPVEEHDQKMDWIITPQGAHRFD